MMTMHYMEMGMEIVQVEKSEKQKSIKKKEEVGQQPVGGRQDSAVWQHSSELSSRAEDQQKHIAICKGEKKTKTLLFHFMLRFPFSFLVIKNSSYQLQPKCHFIYSIALTRAAHGGSVLQWDTVQCWAEAKEEVIMAEELMLIENVRCYRGNITQ